MSLLTYLLLAVTAVIQSQVLAVCPGESNCVNNGISRLSQSDPNYYCQNGAILYARAKKCLDECSITSGHYFRILQDKKNDIDTFCRGAKPVCESVTNTYMTQLGCYNGYGGLNTVLQDIFDKFNQKQTKLNCNKLFWGRYCQTHQQCPYNVELANRLVVENPRVVLGLSVCGSESVAQLAPFVADNSRCSADLSRRMENDCNIGCEVVNARNAGDLCRLFEKQASCIERYSAGCTDAEKKYALPRFDTYAIANKYLRCNIRYKGIRVQLAGGNVCEYSKLINTCFHTNTMENALNFDRLKPLFNKDMPITGFCKTIRQKQAELRKCKNAYMSCVTPHSRSFVHSTTLDDSFDPPMGAFPLNAWGMNYMYDSMASNCAQNKVWSKRICIPPKAIKPDNDRKPDKGNNGGASTPPPNGTPRANQRTTPEKDSDESNRDGQQLKSTSTAP